MRELEELELLFTAHRVSYEVRARVRYVVRALVEKYEAEKSLRERDSRCRHRHVSSLGAGECPECGDAKQCETGTQEHGR